MTTPSTPVFETPAKAGLLSNTHGGNTSTDAIAFTARYQNQRALASWFRDSGSGSFALEQFACQWLPARQQTVSKVKLAVGAGAVRGFAHLYGR